MILKRSKPIPALAHFLKIDPGVSLGANAMDQVETLVLGCHEVEITLGDEVRGPRCKVRDFQGCPISFGQAFEEDDGARETVLDEAVAFAYSGWHRRPQGRTK